MKKVFSILLLLLTFSSLVHAQVNPPVLSSNGSTSSVMPTGNSGAMANQTNNVDLSTGGVSLSIPIYSLGSRNLSTTVSLSYQTPTSSFWYNEYPSSWVGRDWVLNAGGIITKEINQGSVSNTAIFPIYPWDHSAWGIEDIKTRLFAKGDEHRPDVYYYNFDGYAGKFILVEKDGEKVAVTIPHSDLKIVPREFRRSNSESDVSAWTIYTPNGTVYNFGGNYVETTDYDIDYSEYYMKNTGYLGALEHHRRPSYPNRFNSVETNTGWYLNKINTPYNNDSITFEYGNPYSSPLTQATIKHLVNYETNKEEIRKYKVLSGEVRNQRRISKIISLTGSVNFTETADSLIKTIEVKNKSEEIIHNYHLSYQRKDDDHFLVSLQEKVTDCIKKPPYRFEYLDVNGTQINQDPDYPNSISTFDDLPGGLQKIIYPEGGHTKFVYEANKADVTEWEYKDVEERIVAMKDTYDTLDVRYIKIDYTQNLHIRTPHYTNDYGIKIENSAGLIVFNQIITDSLDFILPLSAGKYKIIIDYVNTYSFFPDIIVHLKWKQKWLEPNTNVNAKGWRVRKIVIHDGIDQSKDIVKTYKYELENGNSSGRLIAPPLRFPENTDDYEWQRGSFDAYTYNYYIYESKTDLDVLGYEDLYFDTGGGSYLNFYNYYNLGVSILYPNRGQDTMARLTTDKVYTSLPNYLKGATQIQYTKVTELYGENGEQGYVENYFSYQSNEIATAAPMFTIRDNSWKRGFPIKTKVFDKEGNIISENTSEYEFSSLATHPNQHHEENTLSLIDRTGSYNPIANLYSPTNELYYYNNYAQRFMVGHHYGKEVSGSIFLKKTTTTNYDQDNSGNGITSSTEYEYSDKYLFPNRVIQNENNGDKTISESKYVLDYDTNLGSSNQIELAALRDMKEKHIISPTIEQTVWKQLGGQSEKQLLGASLSTYQIYQTNILENLHMTQSANYKRYFALVPLTTYTFEPINTVQPILSNDFVFSSITPTGLEWDNRFYKKRVIYEGSDRFGNITSAREINGTPSATIFGYNGLFPVASISGASHRQVAYEGFESYGEENPYSDLKEDQVFRGKYSSGRFIANYIEGLPLQRRYLIYPNPFQPIPKGTYTLSFWAKGNVSIELQSSYNDNYNLNFTGSANEWTYHEKDISLNYNAAYHPQNQHFLLYRVGGDDNVRIDEIRFQPKNSFMTTTTYKPLIGVTHTTDAEQRIGSYYYDPLRRIESVRDHNNNLIKSYEYKYMSDDDNPNPLFSISTTPTPEGLINTSITALVNQTDFNRCLRSTSNYRHKWDFGDGTSFSLNSSVINQSHSYSQAGTYVITLSVEVVTGYWVDAHTSIRIIDPSSPPDFTNELTATLNGTVDASNSLCYDFIATPSGGVPPFTYQWFSGDGTSNPSQTTSQINYCYTTFGNFTPRVVVTDATGATANATFDITVTNPIEQLTAEIISANEFCKGGCAFFETNVSGGSPTYTYQWGVINPTNNQIISLGTTSSISFRIPNPTPINRYTIYLTVTDSEGRQVTKTKIVTVVQNGSCNSSTEGFTITNRRGQTVDPTTIAVGDNAIFTSPYIGNGYSYTWKVLLNGRVINNIVDTSNPYLPIDFPSEGNYTITCSVTRIIIIEILGRAGGGTRPFPVGSTTIHIGICNPLRN